MKKPVQLWLTLMKRKLKVKVMRATILLKKFTFAPCVTKSFQRKNRHVVDKIFTCPYCDRTFDDKGNLKLHEKTHKDIRAFSCSAFNKQFKSKIYLKSHEKLHNGEKPFSCSNCDKSFSQSHHLKEHEMSHTGAKFSCSYCRAMFKLGAKNLFLLCLLIKKKSAVYNADRCNFS